jgi:hypothetical protein
MRSSAAEDIKLKHSRSRKNQNRAAKKKDLPLSREHRFYVSNDSDTLTWARYQMRLTGPEV